MPVSLGRKSLENREPQRRATGLVGEVVALAQAWGMPQKPFHGPVNLAAAQPSKTKLEAAKKAKCFTAFAHLLRLAQPENAGCH